MHAANMASFPQSPLVLVVEDDCEIANFVVAAFTKAGFRTAMAHDRSGAEAQFERAIPDLVILDVMLPGADGFRILAGIRDRFDCAVIMLTARTEPSDRIKGLVSGADDYVSKPFHTAELIARAQAVLRRSKGQTAPQTHCVFQFSGWTLDTRARQVRDVQQAVVMLTSGEFDILRSLCSHPGQVLSRDRLVELCQNRAVEPYDRSVDTLVSRIRRKLAPHGGGGDFIKTVRNEGYLFTPEVEVVET